MTAYWIVHKHVIISWTIVGVMLLVFLIWCFHPKFSSQRPSSTLTIPSQVQPDVESIELTSLPRAFLRTPSPSSMLQLPLYEDHGRDPWVSDRMELEKRDGYFYPKGLAEMRSLIDTNTQK